MGDGINDSIALKKADVSISLRGASSIATDTAHIVFLDGGISQLCVLKDIAGNLGRNVKRSWSMIVVPNVSNVIGVFALGSGVMTSVITNNVSALAALANGLLPLRKVARSRPDRPAVARPQPATTVADVVPFRRPGSGLETPRSRDLGVAIRARPGLATRTVPD